MNEPLTHKKHKKAKKLKKRVFLALSKIHKGRGTSAAELMEQTEKIMSWL